MDQNRERLVTLVDLFVCLFFCLSVWFVVKFYIRFYFFYFDLFGLSSVYCGGGNAYRKVFSE